MDCPRCGSKAKFVGHQQLAKRIDGRLVSFGKVRLYNCTSPKCGTSFVHPDDKHLIDKFSAEG